MPESKYSRKGAQGCTCTLPHKGLVWLWFCFSLNPKALRNPRLKKNKTKQTKRPISRNRPFFMGSCGLRNSIEILQLAHFNI